MPPGLFTALVIWAIFLGLIYIGIFGSTWKIGKRLRNATSPWEKFWLWIVRILYIIALPIILVMCVLGAKFMWDDFVNLFKG